MTSSVKPSEKTYRDVSPSADAVIGEKDLPATADAGHGAAPAPGASQNAFKAAVHKYVNSFDDLSKAAELKEMKDAKPGKDNDDSHIPQKHVSEITANSIHPARAEADVNAVIDAFAEALAERARR
jgi:hypothetical protein